MRLACPSTAFAHDLAAGDLTQMEWLERCAGDLAADGAVFDIAHFPRRDPDYLAQLKKFAVDLGLTIVAVRDDEFATAPGDALEIATHLGAPLLLTRLPAAGIDPVTVFDAALRSLGTASGEAKRRNVTIAVRNVPESPAGDAAGLGRLTKETDSAWIRYAIDVATLESGSLLDVKLREKTVLAVHTLELSGNDWAASAGRVATALAGFPGFLCLDGGPAGLGAAALARAFAAWRQGIQYVAEPHVPSGSLM